MRATTAQLTPEARHDIELEPALAGRTHAACSLALVAWGPVREQDHAMSPTIGRLFMVAALGTAACSMNHMSMDGAANGAASEAAPIQARADEHLSRIQAAHDKATADAEVDSYARDLEPMFEAMMSYCASMMRTSAGADAHGAADFMMDAVRGYAAAAHAAPDVASVLPLTMDHHAKITAMVGYMNAMMASMGAMSCGVRAHIVRSDIRRANGSKQHARGEDSHQGGQGPVRSAPERREAESPKPRS